MSYLCETDSCLKSPFLNQSETSMISGSLFATCCHHFHVFSATDCECFWIYQDGSQKPAPRTPFWHPFSILVRPCSARVSLTVPWLVLFFVWFHSNGFTYLLRSILVSKTFPLGTPAGVNHTSGSRDALSCGFCRGCQQPCFLCFGTFLLYVMSFYTFIS